MKSTYLSIAGVIYLLAVYFLFFHTQEKETKLKVATESVSGSKMNVSQIIGPNATIGVAQKRDARPKGVVVSEDAIAYVKGKATAVKLTGAGYGAYVASGSIKQSTIQGVLEKHSVSKGYSTKLSKQIYQIIKGNSFKNAAVLVTATGASLVVQEYLFPELSFFKRLFIALSIGVLILALYIKAQKNGVFD